MQRISLTHFLLLHSNQCFKNWTRLAGHGSSLVRSIGPDLDWTKVRPLEPVVQPVNRTNWPIQLNFFFLNNIKTTPFWSVYNYKSATPNPPSSPRISYRPAAPLATDAPQPATPKIIKYIFMTSLFWQSVRPVNREPVTFPVQWPVRF